jgi:hypothetical protein
MNARDRTASFDVKIMLRALTAAFPALNQRGCARTIKLLAWEFGVD